MQLILSYIANSKHIGFCIGKRARDLFNALDEDGNGFLTEEEFIQGKKNTVNTVFKDHWLNLKKHEVPADHKEAGGGTESAHCNVGWFHREWGCDSFLLLKDRFFAFS